FFSSRRRHTRSERDWSSDVCSSDLACTGATGLREGETHTSEERGCQPGNTNFLAPLEMEKGKAYALMVNNYSQSGHGFRLTWGRSEERRVGKEGRSGRSQKH